MTTKKNSFLDSTGLLVLFSVLFAITTFASIFVVNRTLDPHGSAFSWPQLQLQFAYTPERGMKVLESWGPGSAERYLSVIWIDLVFAASYGPAFFLYIRRLGGGFGWSIVPLFEMLTNWIETSLEIYWVSHHSTQNLLFGVFVTHSVVATIKWCVLVPVYALDLAGLILRYLRPQSAKVDLEGASADPGFEA